MRSLFSLLVLVALPAGATEALPAELDPPPGASDVTGADSAELDGVEGAGPGSAYPASFTRLLPLGVGVVAAPVIAGGLAGIAFFSAIQGGAAVALPLIAVGALAIVATPAFVFAALLVHELLLSPVVSWAPVASMTFASGLGLGVGALLGWFGAFLALSLIPIQGDCYCYPQHFIGPPVGAAVGATLGAFALGAVTSLVIDGLPMTSADGE